MKYEPVMGLEVHVELNTKSKMFCRCSTDYFGEKPNTHTCPVCLGLPGALPYINKAAIEDCIKIGLALNCQVSEKSLFERKNYFYPDLPKGYQISQYRWPLCVGGWLMVNGEDGKEHKIRINRVHQEEDTAKLTHLNTETLIDFNRSGVPLVEIVTEPDFHDVVSVRDYAKKLQQIFRYLGVSNADMERGDMRLEANISVRPEGQKELPNYRIELKNINSFRFMVAAIEYEIKRQIKELEQGRTLHQETRGWDEDKKETYLQRSKEEAHDYRYFPEPDLPEIRMKSDKIGEIRKNLPELPDARMKRFIDEYGLGENNAQILTGERQIADFYEEVVKLGQKKQIDAKQVANYIINQEIDINMASGIEIINELVEGNSGLIEDEDKLRKMAEEVVKENPRAVEDYKSGKSGAIQSLLGAVMKKSQGKAVALKVIPILEELLK